MIPIPAIDLKDGKVVRLLQGDFKEEKVYFQKPEEVAQDFEASGAARIHIVDLDGALGGKPKNWECVEAIHRSVRVPLEVGGGIRDMKRIDAFVKLGVAWVILGTKACLDRGFLREAVHEFGSKVIIGIDARGGFVATDGWTKMTETRAVALAHEAEDLGAKTIIYTDISKDGMMKGPSLAEIKTLSEAVQADVIASGGIGCLDDLTALKKLGRKNITGVIIGKALYENKFTLKEAIRTCSQNA